ncbi:hypothetical protein EGW08_006428 [Elysia chlorotica]|uniref:Uncharacterized protein n=1 Tax=Elysia chlorotica TaxID=188477 RepID=A0A433TW68_ELYCH|nr:hypothetical protein EGW08_006428 [Elysia chlorotica]
MTIKSILLLYPNHCCCFQVVILVFTHRRHELWLFLCLSFCFSVASCCSIFNCLLTNLKGAMFQNFACALSSAFVLFLLFVCVHPLGRLFFFLYRCVFPNIL